MGFQSDGLVKIADRITHRWFSFCWTTWGYSRRKGGTGSPCTPGWVNQWVRMPIIYSPSVFII